MRPEYKFTMYDGKSRKTKLYIYPGTFPMHVGSTCVLLLLKMFNKEAFAERVQRIVRLETEPLENAFPEEG